MRKGVIYALVITRSCDGTYSATAVPRDCAPARRRTAPARRSDTGVLTSPTYQWPTSPAVDVAGDMGEFASLAADAARCLCYPGSAQVNETKGNSHGLREAHRSGWSTSGDSGRWSGHRDHARDCVRRPIRLVAGRRFLIDNDVLINKEVVVN